MRVLTVSHGYPPIVSGVTLVVQKLARAMVRKGHAVTVVTASEHTDSYHEEDDGVKLVRVHSVPNPFWEEAPLPFARSRQLEEIAEEFQPEILHAQESAILALQLLYVNRELDLPLVATCHFVPRFAALYFTWNGEPQDLVETIAWHYSIWLFNQFDCVVFPTSAHRRFFLDKGLHAPTTVISNGVDTTRYFPPNGKPEDVAVRYHLPAGPRILFVSRLARDKEIDVLIRAMSHVYAELGAHLLLAGRGDDRPRLEELTAELGLEHCVHFLGFVPEEDMPVLYRVVDLFAIASKVEVQSIPTLQAAATGLPIVAADALALPELVHNGINGILVPPGDPNAMARAMLEILEDSDLAARMGRESLSIGLSHAEERTFDKYEKLYEELRAMRRPAKQGHAR
jgi:1,2-diacylglycerol 3-alpha-glucosyltransferase